MTAANLIFDAGVASLPNGNTAVTTPASDSAYIQNKTSKLTEERRKRLRLEAIKFFGSKCCKCGFSDIRALQFDHKNGGGVQQLKKIGSRSNYYLFIIQNNKDFQLLCANCNWIKRIENNELKSNGKNISNKMRAYWKDVRAGLRPMRSKMKNKFIRLSPEQRSKTRRNRTSAKKYQERIEKIRAKHLLSASWRRGDAIIPEVDIDTYNKINKTKIKSFSEIII